MFCNIHCFKLFLLGVFVSCLSLKVMANVSEIEHLINYVKNTDCLYERNGTKHKGYEAVEHIRKKYEYYEDDIESTEDFIRLSAKESTMSGKPYKVHCEGKQVVTSESWLLKELNHIRAQK